MKLPNKWRLVKSGDVLDIRDGTHDSPAYLSSGIPLITSKNLTQEGINFESAQFISFADHEQIKKRSGVERGDILYSMIGSIGNLAIVETDIEFSIKNVALFKFGDCEIHNKFFYYLLRSSFVENQILNQQRGGTQKFVSLSILRNLQIPLPPLEEQKRIAQVLDKADRLRQKDHQLLQHYDQLLQSVFLDMFGDPVRNEKGWEYTNLPDVYSKVKAGTKCGPFGSALKRGEFIEEGIPVWIMDNIVDEKLREDGCLFITEEKYKQLESYSTTNGDIIISRAGTVGKMCVINTDREKSVISTNLIRLSLDLEKISPIYFIYLIKYQGHKLNRLKAGGDGAYTFMNTGTLNKLMIPLPPMKVQAQFVDLYCRIEKLKNCVNESIEGTNNLFQSLLQKAFKGELALREIEAVEEQVSAKPKFVISSIL